MKKFLLLFVFIFSTIVSLVAQNYHWPLKTDLKDIKGNLVGINQGVQFKTDAVRGSVAYFDGNSYAKLPSFIKGNTELTVAVWFKMDEIRPWSRIYSFGKGDQTEPKDVMMVIPVNGAGNPTKNWFRFTLSKEGPWLDADVDTVDAKVKLGKWHYSVMVIKKDSVLGYFDNKLVIEEEFSRDLSTMNDIENVLGKSFWPDQLWKGDLSDLRVYTKALAKKEVKELYNLTKMGEESIPEAQYYWPLKNDLKDIKGNLAGINQGVQFKTDAARGSVAYFDGNSYAKLPSFIKGNTELTVATWFRMDELRPWSRIYSFGKGDQSEPKDVMMVIPVNGAGNPTKNWFRFTLSKDGPWLDADVDTVDAKVKLGKWHYSVMVIKKDSVLGYFDNKLIIEEEFSRDLSTMNDIENALGKSFWPDQLWKGALSDLRVYTRSLKKSEVSALYNKTKSSVQTGVSIIPTVNDLARVYSQNNTIQIILNDSFLNPVVSVFDLSGRQIAKQKANEIGNLYFKSGFYIVNLRGDHYNVSTKVYVK